VSNEHKPTEPQEHIGEVADEVAPQPTEAQSPTTRAVVGAERSASLPYEATELYEGPLPPVTAHAPTPPAKKGRRRMETLLAAGTVPVQHQAAEDQAAEDQAVEDQAAEDQAAEDQAVEDQAAEGEPAPGAVRPLGILGGGNYGLALSTAEPQTNSTHHGAPSAPAEAPGTLIDDSQTPHSELPPALPSDFRAQASSGSRDVTNTPACDGPHTLPLDSASTVPTTKRIEDRLATQPMVSAGHDKARWEAWLSEYSGSAASTNPHPERQPDAVAAPTDGAMSLEGYAALRAAIESGQDIDAALRTRGLTRAEWEDIRADWAGRARENSKLANAIRAALANARRQQK